MNGEKPQSEAMVDSHKVDERENALEESKGANCTNEEAYACFDNTGTNRKQASLEFTSLVDSKELSASSPGVLQPRRPRKPKEDKQVESTAVILKGEQKAEDITIGGLMNSFAQFQNVLLINSSTLLSHFPYLFIYLLVLGLVSSLVDGKNRIPQF